MERPSLIAFDVNETLLSLDPVRERMEELFGPEPPVGEWFARMLHGSLVVDAIDQHRPFGEVGIGALIQVAARRGMSISAGDAADVIATMRSLPPHPDVVEGLGRLADAGFAMIALTNGSGDVARAQIENGGIDRFLLRIVSVDEVGRFKPHPEPYRRAAEVMSVPLDGMLLVAAHDWDCAGAEAAGAHSAFLTRPGAHWGLPQPPPEIQVPDLNGLADALGA